MVHTLSACIISMNESDCIRTMLECVKDSVDEIIAVDEYSTDGTREILQEYAAKIIDGRLNNDWASLRNLAISNATMEWVLIIDPDEVMEPQLHNALKTRELLDYCENTGFDAVVMKRKNYINDIFQHYTYPDLTIRLFRNNGKILFGGLMHEQVSGYLNRFESDYHIIHKKSSEKQMKQSKRYQEIINQRGHQ